MSTAADACEGAAPSVAITSPANEATANEAAPARAAELFRINTRSSRRECRRMPVGEHARGGSNWRRSYVVWTT
ncbi:hypothetical protein GCM10010502_59710 [Kitasatospora aureofaciens]|uniref:Uncharacterized protein n=1 Tax=Kitasatospora aureofaciens TaxID=1894 RepID=A0A8H9LWY9_KITAU|nr:hypothetical protein GCM10010502_59710 [Kitasatospora aureofaciens]